MREAIGGTWLMGIVIFFIVLFTSYLALSVNYSKAFRVKNGIVSIIERNRGHTDALAEGEIADYLSQIGYFVGSDCRDRGEGFLPVGDTPRPRYCIRESINSDNATIRKTYYTVTVFFRIDLPIIGTIFTFPVHGVTKPL